MSELLRLLFNFVGIIGCRKCCGRPIPLHARRAPNFWTAHDWTIRWTLKKEPLSTYWFSCVYIAYLHWSWRFNALLMVDSHGFMFVVVIAGWENCSFQYWWMREWLIHPNLRYISFILIITILLVSRFQQIANKEKKTIQELYVESLIEPLRYRQTQQYHFKLCRWREVIIVHWMCFSYRLGQDLHFQDIFPQSGGHMPLLETLVTSSGQHPVAQFMLTSWLYCSDLPEPNFSW